MTALGLTWNFTGVTTAISTQIALSTPIVSNHSARKVKPRGPEELPKCCWTRSMETVLLRCVSVCYIHVKQSISSAGDTLWQGPEWDHNLLYCLFFKLCLIFLSPGTWVWDCGVSKWSHGSSLVDPLLAHSGTLHAVVRLRKIMYKKKRSHMFKEPFYLTNNKTG